MVVISDSESEPEQDSEAEPDQAGAPPSSSSPGAPADEVPPDPTPADQLPRINDLPLPLRCQHCDRFTLGYWRNHTRVALGIALDDRSRQAYKPVARDSRGSTYNVFCVNDVKLVDERYQGAQRGVPGVGPGDVPLSVKRRINGEWIRAWERPQGQQRPEGRLPAEGQQRPDGQGQREDGNDAMAGEERPLGYVETGGSASSR